MAHSSRPNSKCEVSSALRAASIVALAIANALVWVRIGESTDPAATAILAAKRGDYQLCLRVAKRDGLRKPLSARLPHQAGLCAMRLGLFRTAYGEFEKAKKLDETDLYAWFHTATIWALSGNFNRAERDVQWLVVLGAPYGMVYPLASGIESLKRKTNYSNVPDKAVVTAAREEWLRLVNGGDKASR